MGVVGARNAHALVDPGAPLDAKKLVTAEGVKRYTDAMTAYTIVTADSHDEAVRIFAGAPPPGTVPGERDRSPEVPSAGRPRALRWSFVAIRISVCGRGALGTMAVLAHPLPHG